MKKLSFILITLMTLASLFTASCKKNIEKIDDPPQVNESETVRSVINSLRSGPSQSAGRTANQGQVSYGIANYFCFDFVYPISVIYNDGGVQSFSNDNEFAQAIVDQTQSHYIADFVYPFDVSLNGSITTIHNDTELMDAIDACTPLEDFTLSQMSCYELVFPVSVEMSDGSIATATNQQEFEALFGSTSVYPVDMVYPFEIIEYGNTITITNSVDFQVMLYNCRPIYCELPISSDFLPFFDLVYPVTLIYNDGSTIVVNSSMEYDSAIYDSTAGHYIVDFQYNIEVVDNNNGTTTVIHNRTEFFNLINYYISQNPGSGNNQTPLPQTSDFSCFTINYPVTLVYTDGSTQVVHNDTEYDQSIFLPQNIYAYDFQYPITVTQNGSTITLNDRASFDNMVSGCN